MLARIAGGLGRALPKDVTCRHVEAKKWLHWQAVWPDASIRPMATAFDLEHGWPHRPTRRPPHLNAVPGIGMWYSPLP